VSWARRFAIGLLGKARALFHGLGPKGEYPSRLAFRPDGRGEFDEMFAEFANGNVFVETLDRNAVYLRFQWNDGRYCQLWIGCTGRGKLTYNHEDGCD
jgi:hypothetical protein